VALGLMVLAAVAAVAVRGPAQPDGSPRVAGFLAAPAPTVTAGRPTAEAIQTAAARAASEMPPAASPTEPPTPGGARLAAPAARPAPSVIRPLVDRPLYPGQPRQLAQDGCCAGAWWADDGRALHVLDRPPGAPQTAIYRLPLWPPGAAPEVLDLSLADAAGAGKRVLPYGDHSVVEDTATGQRWPLPTGGGAVRLSPDGNHVVWWKVDGGEDRVRQSVTVYGSKIDGTELKDLGALWGTQVLSFMPDNRRVLITGRPASDRPVGVLATLDVTTGERVVIARGAWMAFARMSPDGRWVAYTTGLDRENPDANGVWVTGTDGGPARKLPFQGAYRWRDGGHLVYVPMEPGAASHSVWQLDVATGETTRLLDPAAVPMHIANNDWSISPDGATLAWRAAEDGNVWVVDLP
jgi:hypothetical protein